MAILEYLMNTEVVSSKGKQLEMMGLQLESLIRDCDKTINQLAERGMLGKVSNKMTSVYGAIQPGMSKQMKRIGRLGTAVQKSAVNTNEMATNVANAMSIGASVETIGRGGAYTLTSVKNAKPVRLEDSEDVNTGRAGAFDRVDKMLRRAIKMNENLQKEYGFTDEEIKYLNQNYPDLLTSLYEAKNQKEIEKLLDKINIKLKIYETPVYGEVLIGNDKMSDEKINSNAEYIYWYLRDKGWTKEAICGLLGNMYEESKVNPGAWQYGRNASTGGYGLVQFTYKDREAFCKYMEDKGYNVYEDLNDLVVNNPKEAINCQLDYLMQSSGWIYDEKFDDYFNYNNSEFEDDMPAKVRMSFEEYQQSKASPACLALIFNSSYERSLDGIKKIDERGESANDWYEYFKDYE